MHGWGAGPHPQQLHWRPCLDPHSPGPGDAPTAAGPRWHPPSRRLWGARSPWCLQRRQTLSGRPWQRGQPAGRAGPAWLQLPLTALLLVLASLALLLEVTQLLRGHTQVTTGQVSQLAETLGLLAGCLEPGGWAPELRRWAGRPCGGKAEGAVASGRRELSPLGREGAGQAHPGLVCSCLTGRGRPGPRHPRAPCAQPGGSEGTEGSGVTQHPSLFPGICSLGLPPSQPTPVFHASLAPPPVTAPTSESHPSFSLSSPHAAHKPTSQ